MVTATAVREGKGNNIAKEKYMKEKFKIKGQLRTYMQWPLYLSALLIAANAVIGAVDVKAGIIMAAFTLLYIGISV